MPAIENDIELMQATYYKYMSIDNLDRFLDCVANNHLYGAKYNELNDPFECKFVRKDVDKDIVKGVFDKLGRTRICAMFKKQNDQSFPDNFLMWSHYANSHKGCCFVFGLTEKINQHKWKIVPIDYNNNMPTVNNASDEDIFRVVSVKTMDWEDENEVRAVRIYDNGKNNASPYYHIELQKVYFGINVPLEKCRLYKKIITKIKPGIEVKRIFRDLERDESYPKLIEKDIVIS